MPFYINGMGIISPQAIEEEDFLSIPNNFNSERLACREPDYNKWIDIRQQRRMGRIVKMGVATALQAMKESKVEMPDAIITGTGLGCLEDTASFLHKLSATEEVLNPTPFIQSTHNTIGSQVALLLNCQNYNNTFSHRAFSFESALFDSILLLEEKPEIKILVGSADEITDESHEVQRRLKLFRSEASSSLNMFSREADGTIHGEGAVYFSLSNMRQESSYAKFIDLETFFKPTEQELESAIEKILNKNQIASSRIDVVLSGESGDKKNDAMLSSVLQKLFQRKIATFKQLCGEYSTTSSFAVWLAAKILRHQAIPEALTKSENGPLKNVLIVNQYCGSYYSILLLSSCLDM